jgi:hypothetical protein
MAIYQMAVMGGSAGGAALWGKVASLTSVGTSLLLSAGLAVILLLLTRRVTLDGEVHTPSAHAVPAAAEA